MVAAEKERVLTWVIKFSALNSIYKITGKNYWNVSEPKFNFTTLGEKSTWVWHSLRILK